jgi:hypothetical protein
MKGRWRLAPPALLAGAALALAPALALGDEGMRGPGAHGTPRPPLQGRLPDFRPAPADPKGVGTVLLLGLLSFYRNAVSAVDGDRCSMAPTCSLYSRQAVQEHGALLGVLLTADRLLHEADEIPLVPSVEIGGEAYSLDPLEANTYWWR